MRGVFAVIGNDGLFLFSTSPHSSLHWRIGWSINDWMRGNDQSAGVEASSRNRLGFSSNSRSAIFV